jgi:HSP20 family protein
MRFINFEPVNFDSVKNLNFYGDGIKSLLDEFTGLQFNDTSTFNPKFDISEDKNKLYFEAEIPGISKNEIKISMQDNILTISGEKKKSEEVKEKNYFRTERTYGTFKRSFTLPSDIDIEKTEAKFENGILLISIPKYSVDRNIEKMIEIK